MNEGLLPATAASQPRVPAEEKDNASDPMVPTDLDPLYAGVEVLSALLSIVGNFFVLLLFVRDRSLRTVKNYYAISLASADLLVGLVGVPSALAVSVGLPRDFYACLATTSLLLILCTGSIVSLVAVTVDRFWAIALPLSYPAVMTPFRARAVISVAWFLATVVGLLPIFGWNCGAPTQPGCFFVKVTDPRYLVFLYFGTIVSPSVFMGLLYAIIYRTVKLQGRRLSKLLSVEDGGIGIGSSSQRQQRLLQHRQLATEARTASTIAVVVVVFLVSWLPLYTVNAVSYFCPACAIGDWLMKLTIVLSHLNSVWNPLLYAWGMSDFRTSLAKFWRKSNARKNGGLMDARYWSNGCHRGRKHVSVTLDTGSAKKPQPL